MKIEADIIHYLLIITFIVTGILKHLLIYLLNQEI
jgi:hypothetical protein